MFKNIGFFASSVVGPAGSSAALAITQSRDTGSYSTWTVLGSPYYYIWYTCSNRQAGDIIYYQANNGVAGSLVVYSDAGITVFSTTTLSGQYSGSITLPAGTTQIWIKFTRAASDAASGISIRIGP